MDFRALLVVIAAFADEILSKPVVDEPMCTSRYDFESSLLRDMVKLDFDMTVLKQSYSDDMTNVKTETKLATKKLETATIQLEESQTQVLSELTALGKTQKKKLDEKINELEEAKTLLQDEINKRLSTLELKMATKVEELSAAKAKRPTAFLVKTLPDTTSGLNKVLKFTESVWNTNGVYDSTSGYFTAPVNGTYVFNLQLCIATNVYVHAQMLADGVVINNAIFRDITGGNPCSTINAVAVLDQGGRVCARLGNEYDSGHIIVQENNRWASFMGVLVN